MNYLGIPIHEDKNMVDKIQIRQHKKKRINKKWNKSKGIKYLDVPKRDLFVVDIPLIIVGMSPQKAIVGHPKMIEILKQQINHTQ